MQVAYLIGELGIVSTIGSLASLTVYLFFFITHSGFFTNEVWLLLSFYFVSIFMSPLKKRGDKRCPNYTLLKKGKV